MKAAFLLKPGVIEIRDTDMPVPGPEDLLIKIKRLCICGSDNHIYKKGTIAGSEVKMPFILGHECSGDVVKAGKSVKGFKAGDRVAIEPSGFCGTCEFCKSGHYNMCDNYTFMAAPPDNPGALCEYVIHNFNRCFVLPDCMSYEEGALVEPLSIVIQAFEISNFNIGDDILITGAGPIGLLVMMLLKTIGAGRCFITDINDIKLKIAQDLGAEYAINPDKRDLKSFLFEKTSGKGIPVIFDTVGSQSTLNDNIFIAKKNATLVIIGISDEKASFNIVDLICKMLVIKGTTDFVNIFPKAISLIRNKKIDVLKVVSHRYNFEEIAKAFQNLNSNPETLKTIIEFD